MDDSYSFPLSPLPLLSPSTSPCPSSPTSLLSDLSSSPVALANHFSPAPSTISSTSSSSSFKENHPPPSFSPCSSFIGSPSPPNSMATLSGDVSYTRQLSAIEVHRKMGPRSLQELKTKVRRYANDGHTFKETAKKFGVHHSTVSGWVKAKPSAEDTIERSGESTKDGVMTDENPGMDSMKPDELFIGWLKERRLAEEEAIKKGVRSREKADTRLTAAMIGAKVKEILADDRAVREAERKCKWFILWNERRESRHRRPPTADEYGLVDEVEGLSSPMSTSSSPSSTVPNLAYPPSFKLEVALFARSHSQYAASKLFAVARRRIFDWLRQLPRLQDLLLRGQSRKATGRGPRSRDVDRALFDWYCARKAAGDRPKSSQVQAKAKQLYTESGHADMKCSYGWFKRWSQRFKIQLRYSHDDDLLEWILCRFDANESITLPELQNFGLELIRREDPEFKASSGWAMRFCRRHRHLLNPNDAFDSLLLLPTHEADPNVTSTSRPLRLPDRLESRSHAFLAHLRSLNQDSSFTPEMVCCFDELALHFNSSSSSGCGAHSTTATLKHAGVEQADAVVVLAATAAGTLLPPMLVFRHQSTDSTDEEKNGDFPTDLVIHHDPQLVSEEVTEAWVRSVWMPYIDSSSNNNSSSNNSSFLLVADSAPCHSGASLSALASAQKGFLALLPGATSPRLQPLHRGVKMRFKSYVEQMHFSRLRDGNNNKNPNWVGSSSSPSSSSKPPKPTQRQIAQWVSQAYHSIKQDKDLIIKSFQDTGIYQHV